MDKEKLKALEWCVFKRIPFVAYCLPNTSHVEFWAAPSLLNMSIEEWYNPCKEGFFISEFNHSFKDNLWIPFELSAKELLKQRMHLPENNLPFPTLQPQSTSKADYIKKIDKIIEKEKSMEVAKVVIAIVRTLFEPTFVPTHNFSNLYFNAGDDTFVSCFYHPATGFWMGGTPELLLEYNYNKKIFHTMALAGTLPLGEKWDEKNVIEHSYVSHYISECIKNLASENSSSKKPDIVYYGNIKHICIKFSGKTDDPIKLIDRLNPTPALLGYPIEFASDEIFSTEQFPRRCYGGYIGVKTNKSLTAYVNIRCCNFDKSSLTFYGGGGIVAESNAEAEWDEANRKIDQLIDFMEL